jgi:hypothetical protein
MAPIQPARTQLVCSSSAANTTTTVRIKLKLPGKLVNVVVVIIIVVCVCGVLCVGYTRSGQVTSDSVHCITRYASPALRRSRRISPRCIAISRSFDSSCTMRSRMRACALYTAASTVYQQRQRQQHKQRQQQQQHQQQQRQQQQ